MLMRQIPSPSQLTEAAQEFERQCIKFKRKYPKFAQIKTHEFEEALGIAGSQGEAKLAAELFGHKILEVSDLVSERRDNFNSTWAGKLKNFLTALYPVVKLGLALTGVAADVPIALYDITDVDRALVSHLWELL
jgi:hypothetical protein